MKNIVVFFVLVMNSFYIFAYDRNTDFIKVAILDNPNIISSNYEAEKKLKISYMEGIDTAVSMSKKYGYTIRYKTFFYGNNLLDIINKIPDVKEYDPDVIVGLHNSNQFLMVRNYFSHEMVISMLASDPNIRNMQPNFYSLGIPDEYASKIISIFTKTKFHDKDIFFATEVGGKDSVDIKEIIKSSITQKYPNKIIGEGDFLEKRIDSLDMSKFLKNYRKDRVIIILAVDYYSCVKMMSKISKYLAPNYPVFIATLDNLEWPNMAMASKKSDYIYTGYRLAPLLMDSKNKNYAVFYKEFLSTNKKPPSQEISYVTYNSIMSVIHALKKYPSKNSASMKQMIYKSYQKALLKNPNWFRPDKMYIYLMTQGKEQLLENSYPLYSNQEKL